MPKTKNFISLDVGSKRIGVALADDEVKIAIPLDTIEVDDGQELQDIKDIVDYNDVSTVVVGYPRNQQGLPTQQSKATEEFVDRLRDVTSADIVYQDESLTSVMAEDRLKRANKAYSRADIDMTAASIILNDYLESARL